MPLGALAALFVGLGAYQTFVELADGRAGRVSHSAHLGGAVLGFVAHRLGWFAADLRASARPGIASRLVAAWGRRRAAAASARDAARELQLDAILAKVKTAGLNALDAAERRFLEQQSARSRRGS
jgi:hypothetical protein